MGHSGMTWCCPMEGSRMRFPSPLLEFQTQFPDEASCWAYLRRVRWPQGFRCPRCRGHGSHFLTVRRLEPCRSCRDQGSVTAGTVFHGTRVPLRIGFLGLFFVAGPKKGISARQFQRDSGVGNSQTAWTLLHKLRSGLAADRCCVGAERWRRMRLTSGGIARGGSDGESARRGSRSRSSGGREPLAPSVSPRFPARRRSLSRRSSTPR
ncbi:MAG: transposase [Deltaproteobacteria bacterium]|nr:MAG: transposase [Deltaproteobacteria bacterium]